MRIVWQRAGAAAVVLVFAISVLTGASFFAASPASAAAPLNSPTISPRPIRISPSEMTFAICEAFGMTKLLRNQGLLCIARRSERRCGIFPCPHLAVYTSFDKVITEM